MTEGFFIGPEYERSDYDNGLIDPASGARIGDIEGGMWVRGPDGTALPAYPYLDGLRMPMRRLPAPEFELNKEVEEDSRAIYLLLLLP